jgi:hypothetical protein
MEHPQLQLVGLAYSRSALERGSALGLMSVVWSNFRVVCPQFLHLGSAPPSGRSGDVVADFRTNFAIFDPDVSV